MKKRGFRAVSSLVAACMLSVAGMPTIKAYADVYSITEKAPKLYSTREFSGAKL